MRKLVCIIAFLLLGANLWIGVQVIFSEAHREFEIASHPVISEPVTFLEADVITWIVPTHLLRENAGEGIISLVCDAPTELSWDDVREVLSSSSIRATRKGALGRRH